MHCFQEEVIHLSFCVRAFLCQLCLLLDVNYLLMHNFGIRFQIFYLGFKFIDMISYCVLSCVAYGIHVVSPLSFNVFGSIIFR